MTQKVATVCKMKSQQETLHYLPLPNCDSDIKADHKWQAFINTDTRRFKIQTGDMGLPPPPLAGPLHRPHCRVVNNYVANINMCRFAVGQLSVNCWYTAGRQLADSIPTFGQQTFRGAVLHFYRLSYMLQVKIKFRFSIFNPGWFSILFVS